jgi:hypothetical protein
MANYISSNNNRFYAGLEASYGAAAAMGQVNRIPAVSLKTKHQRERLQRRDKTGTRTFLGLPAASRYKTSFELNTYMAAWTDPQKAPAHGALLAGALGGTPLHSNGGGIVSGASGYQLTFAVQHGLAVGQAVACGNELRFVAAIPSPTTVQLNAPFTAGVANGTAMLPTYTYTLGEELKSATIMDYWSPGTAVQRILYGAAIDQIQIDVNGDFHEFRFSGPSADMIDSASFAAGQAGLQQFPAEPDSTGFDYTIIPGHLGQAWIGSIAGQFFTLASAKVTFSNNVDLRAHEFGYLLPRAIAPGQRDVRVDFSVYAQDDAQTQALYQASRQQSPVSVMFQLGQQQGQLCGVFLKNVMAEVPEYDDSATRLIWNFKSCRAQGIGADEIAIAFA